jgi:hypothetical protein
MRSEEYLEEFHQKLQALDDATKKLVLDGQVEICPCCDELSSYAWDSTTAYEEIGNIVPGGFKPKAGTIAHISNASGLGEWECGHCKQHLVERDSVLNDPCFTH